MTVWCINQTTEQIFIHHLQKPPIIFLWWRQELFEKYEFFGQTNFFWKTNVLNLNSVHISMSSCCSAFKMFLNFGEHQINIILRGYRVHCSWNYSLKCNWTKACSLSVPMSGCLLLRLAQQLLLWQCHVPLIIQFRSCQFAAFGISALWPQVFF